jgi:hypothetical protein
VREWLHQPQPKERQRPVLSVDLTVLPGREYSYLLGLQAVMPGNRVLIRQLPYRAVEIGC